MKIYTKNGDKGRSSINGVKPVLLKSDTVFEVLGTFDELNASLGFLSLSKVKIIEKNILQIQKDLFSLGSLIISKKATIKESDYWKKKTEELEKSIDNITPKLPELHNFIIPGGCREAIYLHQSRVICRRLERNYISYCQKKKINNLSFIGVYLNRLSDYLFVLARFANKSYGIKDTTWTSN